MFCIDPAPTFPAAVALSIPGQAKPREIKVTFRHKNRTATDVWSARAHINKPDAPLLDEVIVSWEGVQDAAGEPVPYSLTALSDLLESYGAAWAEFLSAYISELRAAKAKN